MKSAEELVVEWQQKSIELQSIDAGIKWCDEERIKFWKAALLNAYKDGMTEAVKVMENEQSVGDEAYNEYKRLKQAILSARDKKTSL